MEQEIKSLEMTAKQLLETNLDGIQRELVLKLVSDSLMYLSQHHVREAFSLQVDVVSATQRRGGLFPADIVLH